MRDDSQKLDRSIEPMELALPTRIDEAEMRPGDVVIPLSTVGRGLECLSGLDVEELGPLQCCWHVLCLATLVEAMLTRERLLTAPTFREDLPAREVTLPLGFDIGPMRMQNYQHSIRLTDEDTEEYTAAAEATSQSFAALRASSQDLEDSGIFSVYAVQGIMDSYECFLQVRPHGFPFMTDPVSAPLSIRSIVSSAVPPRAAARLAIDLIEGVRSSEAREANERAGAGVFQLFMPAVLTAVLREASSPEDFLAVVNQMRSSREAISFRKWASELDSETSPRQFNERIQELQRVGDGLSSAIGMKEREIQWNVAVLGMGAQIASRTPTGLRRALAKLSVLGRRHISLLCSLHDSLEAQRSIGGDVERLFALPAQVFDTGVRLLMEAFVHASRTGQSGRSPAGHAGGPSA